MTNSLKARLFGTEAWNNEWYVYVGSPIFAVIGVLLGWLFGVHLVSSALEEALVVALFVGVSVVVGNAILAVIDRA